MKVSLISLNLNGAAFLGTFLDSVRFELDGYYDAELILLDNGSTDNSVEYILNNYPWVRLVQSPKNTGFAGGCHLAAKESDAEYLIFLNNDMQLEPGFIEEILRPFETEDRIGSVAGFVLNETGTQVDYAGGDINLFGWGFQRHHGEQVAEVEDKCYDIGYPEQFFACGGAIAMKRETWLTCGGFDPDFFAFFEDVDLGWRLNIMGLKTILAPRAKVKHKHHGTASSMSVAVRTFLLERNALMTVIKNFDDDNLGKILPWAISMMNERSLIDSASYSSDAFRGRWYEDIFGSKSHYGPPAQLRDGEIVHSKGLKDRAKSAFKKATSSIKFPVRHLAIEWVFENWISIMDKREIIQESRKIADKELIDLIEDKYRTVTGHEREKNLMEVFRKHVQF